MTSVRSALDLVGKVIVGRLSDTMGRFPALYLGVMASMAGTILFGTIDSLSGLWLAMLPGALFGHTFVIMKAYLSDHARAAGRGSDESAGALGKLGLAGGLGFMLGPTLGGHLVKDYQQAAVVSFSIQVVHHPVVHHHRRAATRTEPTPQPEPDPSPTRAYTLALPPSPTPTPPPLPPP